MKKVVSILKSVGIVLGLVTVLVMISNNQENASASPDVVLKADDSSFVVPDGYVLRPETDPEGDPVASEPDNLIPAPQSGSGELDGSLEEDAPQTIGASSWGKLGKITEDSPRWDCRTMGNHVCGPNGSKYKPGCYVGKTLVIAWTVFDNPRTSAQEQRQDDLWADLTICNGANEKAKKLGIRA